MSQSTFRQDMPPPGGYSSIPFKRVPIRAPLTGLQFFLGYGAITALGIYLMKRELLQNRKLSIESWDVSIALSPLLYAERDRLHLLQLLKNRDEERELMKNIPGWKVGMSLNGEPMYKTLPDNYYVKPILDEYYAHTSEWSMKRQRFFSFFFN